MTRRRSLEDRFLESLAALGVEPGRHLLVAVSGGCDSVVLLHLLRFAAAPLGLRLTAAHLDHAMRPGSDADARWVAGLCAAWGVPLLRERAAGPPRGEDAARRARYAFLRRAAAAAGADAILTAHQADDQAETVLFRVLRGTGLTGLAGIPARGAGGVLRPLLPFWRRELRRYARARGLRWRTDPTNLSLGPVRNRIRLRLLPRLEREVAPRARRRLVQLAELAREAEAGWAQRLAALESELVRREGDSLLLARDRLRDYDWETGARLLRNLLRQFGIVLSRTGTRTALQFITGASSGREMQLPEGVRVRTEFEVARIVRPVELPPDRPLTLEAAPAAGGGRGSLRLGGRGYRAAWRVGEDGGEPREGEWRAALALAALRFPLRLRAWEPGDRLRTAAGTKTLKKLFVERRVPRSLRSRLPVLVDAAGAVLWVAGVGSAAAAAPRPGEDTLLLTLTE